MANSLSQQPSTDDSSRKATFYLISICQNGQAKDFMEIELTKQKSNQMSKDIFRLSFAHNPQIEYMIIDSPSLERYDNIIKNNIEQLRALSSKYEKLFSEYLSDQHRMNVLSEKNQKIERILREYDEKIEKHRSIQIQAGRKISQLKQIIKMKEYYQVKVEQKLKQSEIKNQYYIKNDNQNSEFIKNFVVQKLRKDQKFQETIFTKIIQMHQFLIYHPSLLEQLKRYS